jgi:hypothetical protein
MLPSGLGELPKNRQKDTDLDVLRKRDKNILLAAAIIYYCSMRHRCECNKTLQVVMVYHFIELQLCGTHDPSSHQKEKKTKGLLMDRNLAVMEAAITC